jgi:AcrR family transcriptional regulator
VGHEAAAAAEAEATDTVEVRSSTGRQQRADACRNRDRLLEAAAAAFAAKGAEVPLEEVARGAGVGIATLYRHFPTRDSLIAAVYRHEVDILCQQADDLLATLPPDQALAEWMQLFVRHVARKRGMATALKSMMGESATSFFEETRGRAVAAATKLVEAGAAAGTIRGDIDGSDLLRAVGGICMSTDQERADASERLVGLLFDGLRHGAGATATPTVTSS